MTTYVTWEALMHYAKQVGIASKSGDPEKLAKAEAELEAYKQLCLEADEMKMPFSSADLYYGKKHE